jgi:hypothetical protein
MTKLTPRFVEMNPQPWNGGLQGFSSPASQPVNLNPMIIPAPVVTEPPKKKGRPKKAPPQEQTMNIPTFPPFATALQEAPLKVALIGTAPSSRMLAPYNDPSWKIWGCSPGNQGVLPRVDAWFEIHGTNLLEPATEHYGKPYLKWLNEQKFPVYMQDSTLVPHATPYPVTEMVKEFGPYYFTSSFAWMMALAITQGAKEIALYGIDMASRDEYIIQRPGAYYFLIRGAERGCKIWAPYESDIMQPPGLYGFSDVRPFGRKIRARKSEIDGRLGPMRQQRATLDHDITYLEGAREDIDYMESIHGGVQDNSDISYLSNLINKTGQEKPNG